MPSTEPSTSKRTTCAAGSHCDERLAAGRVAYRRGRTKTAEARQTACRRRANTRTAASDAAAAPSPYSPLGISSHFHGRTGTTTKTYGAETDMAGIGAAAGGRRRRTPPSRTIRNTRWTTAVGRGFGGSPSEVVASSCRSSDC